MGRRWLGPSHANKVRVNPLHYSSDIENCRECIRCTRVLHKSAFRLLADPSIEVGVCRECREELISG